MLLTPHILPIALAVAAPPVQVVLDLDAQTPGFQSNLTIPQGTTVVEDVAVYVLDPSGRASVYGIGYLGGLDRAIALGHVPANTNLGAIVALIPALGAPVNPGNVPWIDEAPLFDPAFAGPEVQYYESGARGPAIIGAEPADPIFTADIVLSGAAAGDVFDFYLADNTAIWTGGAYGCFSTRGFQTLDTGGDSVADGTVTIHGVDADASIPVPPGSFKVDFIDGPPGGGPATITVVPIGDLDGDGQVGVVDLLLLLQAWGSCPDPPAPCPADLTGDGAVGVADLLVLLGAWLGQ